MGYVVLAVFTLLSFCVYKTLPEMRYWLFVYVVPLILPVTGSCGSRVTSFGFL